MGWKWFRFTRVATAGTLPTLNEASPMWAQDTKKLNIHDGTEWRQVPFSDDMAGMIVGFGNSTAPTGWLACDGSAVSRTTYAKLFTAISTTWGVGDGSTTFNLPDLRETALVGIGTRGSGVTAHDTYTIGQFKDDQMQGHLHSLNTIYATQGSPGGNSIPGSSTTHDQELPSSGPMISDGINGTPRIGTTTHGKQAGVLYCIKY
jgi:microcystin-dependent protein